MTRVALRLSTSSGCSLAINGYPRFQYDARGGGGDGMLMAGSGCSGGGPLLCQFPPEHLVIPPLNWRSCRLLGLPLPPGLEIRIEPQRLEGSLDPVLGALQLHFQARFHFNAGAYRPPHLQVEALLTTGTAEPAVHPRWGELQGEPLDATGRGRLVGVARVPPCGDRWLDRWLGLPGEALAQLSVTLSGQETIEEASLGHRAVVEGKACEGLARAAIEPTEHCIEFQHRGIETGLKLQEGG